MTEEPVEYGQPVTATIVDGAADGEQQVWILVPRAASDPFDLIDVFEIGSPLVICRSVRKDGVLVFESGEILDDELTMQLLQRERCGRA